MYYKNLLTSFNIIISNIRYTYVGLNFKVPVLHEKGAALKLHAFR